ncbi:uncharacterized protein MONBRDRAFT_21956 [Monosiga brevicollis MX1]|uniref:Amidase domain-containing protein n=1 Tax=Monosiga brevicollis TaxID=81824 RepID=A9UP46_MONBE|nr:uncharacterized protein MONBRDRAFT_21956 [Monosiga brevicollis MX1]EDQ92809.1 predicted protein [Monosiga brevicollis MX1]|eukprot:XP_001742571.1 hypothetical protein [Monosiga brevicollis MX1]
MEMLALLLPSDGSAWTITVQPVGVYALGSTAVACVGLKYLIDWYKRSQHRDAAAKLGHHAKTLREQRLDELELDARLENMIDLSTVAATREALSKYGPEVVCRRALLNCLRDPHNAVCEIVPSIEGKAKDSRGDLAGVPFTVKECLHIEGLHCTFGDAKRTESIMTGTSLVVRARCGFLHIAVARLASNLRVTVSLPGPMAPTVEGCVTCFRAVVNDWPWAIREDPSLLPLSFDEAAYTSTNRLRLGVLVDNDFFDVTPACRRAVDEAVAAAKALGHEVVPMPGHLVSKIAILFYALVSADGGHQTLELLRHQVSEAWHLAADADEVHAEFMALWHSLNLDGLITPASVMPPPKQGTCSDLTPGCWPTFIFNLLDMPAGIIPATRVTAEDDRALRERDIIDRFDRILVDSCADSEGSPVGVQVVTPRFQDELCFRIMGELESKLKPNA